MNRDIVEQMVVLGSRLRRQVGCCYFLERGPHCILGGCPLQFLHFCQLWGVHAIQHKVFLIKKFDIRLFIPIEMFCGTNIIFITFMLNVRNILQNAISPTKHCYGSK